MTAATVTLDDLWEVPPDSDLPPLDRAGATPTSAVQAAWQRDGYLILRDFLPVDLVDAYCSAYDGGWGIGTPYLQSPELLALAAWGPVGELLEHLIGEPMGLHLNLTWWRSTERDWHQDDYLNPPYVNGHYAAVWMALDDIHPDSGPFEFVPGSHRWPIIRRANVLAALGEDGTDPDWPWRSEQLLSPLVETEMGRVGATSERFLARKGDMLVWHSRLMHRGSRARVPGMERRALISHYSGLNHRHDMPRRARNAGQAWHFVF